MRYTPDANYNGTDAYTYTVSSGGTTETVTVNVTITPVNDAPTFGGDTTESGNEDGAPITGTLSVADAADGITAPAFTVSANAAHGTASVNAATGAWTYTPTADFNGTDSFTVRVTDDDGFTATQVITVTVGAVADIANDTATVAEDGSVLTNVLGNDSFEGGTRSVTAVTNGANGTVTIVDAAAGTVLYTPNANFNGTDTYTYTVTSGGVTETATVSVTVTPVNDPVTFGGNTSGAGAEDGAAITGVLSAADAADGMTAPNFTVSANGAHGTATIDPATGAWTYTPAADYNGPDSFTVTVSDNAGNTATRVINVTATAVADIAADTVTVAEDGSVTANLLANDSFEGTPTITSVTSGAHGTVTIIDAAAGTVLYTADPDFHGTDTYTYTVTSGGVTETATVTVTVSPVDDPTTFGGATSGSGNEDGGAITGTLTAADAVDGMGTPAFTVTSQPAHGTATINAATGAWSYVPAADYNGADSFTVRVTDDQGHTSTQVISLAVAAVADIAADTATVAEDGSVTSALRGNDSFEGATPTVTAVTSGAHGTVAIVNAATGTVSYTPDANWHGTDTYTYTVTSGGVTETATVTVTVTPVDDAAVFGGATSGSGNEDGAPITGTLTVSDTDGLPAARFTVSANGGHGTATIDATTGLWSYVPDADFNGADSFTVSVTDNDGNVATRVIGVSVAAVVDALPNSATVAEDGSVTTNVLADDGFAAAAPTVTSVTQGAHGTVTVLDAPAGTVLYTPDANFHGTDSYTYTVTSGGVTETATVTVTVSPVNDPVTFGGHTAGAGNEDGGAITGTLTATDLADGMPAPAFTVTGNPAHGTASIDASGAWTYTPAADYNGNDSFTVTVTDALGNTATQVIALTVAPVADIVANSVTVAEDGSVTSPLLANDNFEGAATITAVSRGANGSVVVVDAAAGTVLYTPNANFHGTDSYTYTVTSGGVTETATVTVTVSPVNDATFFSGATAGSGNEDGGAITGTLNVADADGIAAPAFSVTASPAHGTATINPANGARVYTPAADYNGPDSFTVTVTDNRGNTATQVIGLTVAPVADIAADSATAAEDGGVTANLLANDSFESSGAAITAVTQGTHGTVTIIDAALGTVRYTADANWHGTDTYTYTVTAGGVTETATVTVTVNPVDDPASFGGATTGSGNEDAGAITGTLTAADAADGMTAPAFTVVGSAAHGTASIDPASGAGRTRPSPTTTAPTASPSA
ncbi:tandem-95 repeat protein [Ramlibacter terrae]|uniref:Tandem-95 repeat protein n=1 Tax=Ramlibacter terrae TaxID=2732511 RepID=A0ABX6P3C2_9BURK|nr:tandem-95 repeat protein [Ramlibacter terrae]